MFFEKPKVSVEVVQDEILEQYGIQLSVKRLDLNHPRISGNKYFKLKYNIEEAQRLEKTTLVTFGGAYSNHIRAVAQVGKETGFKTIGVIRGEEEKKELNHILKEAQDYGMEFVNVTREEYRNKENADSVKKVLEGLNNYYLIPEGGSNELAVKGCKEILNESDAEADFIFVPCGTGGTLAGIALSLLPHQTVLGISVLKGGEFLKRDVTKLLNFFPQETAGKWDILLDYHFGGYAKAEKTLTDFIQQFMDTTGIAIEPVYSGKMFYAIYDLVKTGYFKKGTTVMAIHTGGVSTKT